MAVIGIGQSLRGDDAAGIEAVRAWISANPGIASRTDVRVEMLEVPGLGLLDLLEDVDAAVIVDAVQAAEAPGTLLRLTVDGLDAFDSSAKFAHGWGAAETLRIGRRLDPRIATMDLRVIGIAGKEYAVGSPMTPEVWEALPRASIEIQNQVEQGLSSNAG